MIERVNGSSFCHDRLSRAGLKAKTKIGFHFKKEIHDAMFDLKDCSFHPKTNQQPNGSNTKVLKTSKRLHKEAELREERRKKTEEEQRSQWFKPKTCEYSPSDFYRKHKNFDRLGLTNDSRLTKYYYEGDFSPSRYHRSPETGGFGKRTKHFSSKSPALTKSLFQDSTP